MDTPEVDAAWFTVCGLYRPNFQRYVSAFEAASPQMAEAMAQMEVTAEGADGLMVATVIPGQPKSVDTYAAYADPTVTSDEGMAQVLKEWGIYG